MNVCLMCWIIFSLCIMPTGCNVTYHFQDIRLKHQALNFDFLCVCMFSNEFNITFSCLKYSNRFLVPPTIFKKWKANTPIFFISIWRLIFMGSSLTSINLGLFEHKHCTWITRWASSWYSAANCYRRFKKYIL